jgi:hypothetical protein
MEAELALLDESLPARTASFDGEPSHGADEAFTVKQDQAKANMVLTETAHTTSAFTATLNAHSHAITGSSSEVVSPKFVGVNRFQVEMTESHVSGTKCQHLRGVDTIGGPAALPTTLANNIVLFAQAGYKGSRLRDMVSNAFSTELPGSGPWNLIAGVVDWNLYHEESKVCTVAVKFPKLGNLEEDWFSDWVAFGA